MTGWQTMRRVVLPQAFKNILPALGNEFVTVIKESSIVMTISITELMFDASQVYSSSFRYFESLVVLRAGLLCDDLHHVPSAGRDGKEDEAQCLRTRT